MALEGDLLPDELGPGVREGSRFDPVLITVRLPHTLQKISKRYQLEQSQKIESFRVIFDGNMVVYAAEVDPKQPFFSWVFADLRDRLVELLGPEHGPKLVAPNTTTTILLSHSTTKETALADMYFWEVPKGTDWRSALTWLYLGFKPTLGVLFWGSKLRLDAIRTGRKVEIKESALLRTLGLLIGTHWYSLRTRGRLLETLRRDEVETLSLLSKYLDIKRQTKYCIQVIRYAMSRDELLRGFMEHQTWESDVTEDVPTGTVSVTRTIEHVRSESQALQGVSGNYLAALIGVAAGGIVTLILTELPAILALVGSFRLP